MRYTKRYKLANGKNVWKFDPPKDALLAGVVTKKIWRDGRSARYESKRLEELVDKFRAGELEGVHLGEHSPINVIISWYVREAELSEVRYKCIRACREDFGHKAVGSLDVHFAQKVYDRWIKNISISHANQKMDALIAMMDFATQQGIITGHTLHSVSKLPPERHADVRGEWTEEAAVKFVDKCMESVETASLGVMAVIIAHTLQSASVVKELTWDKVDFNSGLLSCGNATIRMQPELQALLQQQHDRWGHQRWVVPFYSDYDRIPRPYPQLSRYTNPICEQLGISPPLYLGDLRDLYVHKHAKSGVSPEVLVGVTGMSRDRVLAFYNPEDLSIHLPNNVVEFPRR